ncbi:DUF2059 domain-containing protein [Vibrio sp. M60_M31a]
MNATGKEELVNIYRDWFVNDINRQNIIVEMGALYSQAFSQQEIELMIEFYATPVGQKLVENRRALNASRRSTRHARSWSVLNPNLLRN